MRLIKSVSMANYLLDNKFALIRIDKDRADESRLVFIFEDSNDLRNAMGDYKSIKN
jgi:hypothetical protein